MCIDINSFNLYNSPELYYCQSTVLMSEYIEAQGGENYLLKVTTLVG